MFALVAALVNGFLNDYLRRREERAGVAISTLTEQKLYASTTRSTREVIWMRPLLIVCASWVLGNVSRALRPSLDLGGIHYEALVALFLLIATSLALVIYHRSHSPVRGQGFYQLEVFALWAGHVSGWSMVHGSAWGDLIVVNIAWWLGCAVVGGGLLGLMVKRQR